MIWRLVEAKYGTLIEISTLWSIDDILDAHDVLNVKLVAEDALEYDAEQKRKKR